MTLINQYLELLNIPSDIQEHLPTLQKHSSMVDHCTEMGVRYGNSTIALLAGKPKTLISYDINEFFDWQKWQEIVKKDTNFLFIKEDVLKVSIEPTNLLFIDTIHNYTQLSQELKLHSDKVSDFIILHDTETFKNFGESYTGKSELGLGLALEEFLKDNKEWTIREHYTNNNGLTILERV